MEVIADATIRLIDQVGLHEVTMRRVAEELNTGAASLYRHVSGRDELLVLVADKSLEALGEATGYEGLTWRQLCERAAHGYRDLLLRRPAVAALLERSQLLGPNSLRGREIMLRELLARGFPPTLAVHTYLTVIHYVMGSVRVDDRSTKRDPDEREALKELFSDLDREQYPTVVGLADILGGLEPDDEFEFGLQALLDGIATQLERNG
jgi:AcrR family transcriptional regulator